MFVQDFIEVPRSVEAILAHLLLPGWLQGAGAPGIVTLGTPRHRDAAVLVPITMQLGHDDIGITLSGDLELVALPDGATHVQLSASYPRPAALASGYDVTRHVAVAARKLLRVLLVSLVPGESMV